MRNNSLAFALLVTFLGCLLSAAPAHAQQRVFVAGTGSDSNPCTVAAPCRSFQQAHNTVAAGGEIDVLDAAGYGAVTISKAISIQGHDYSGISVPSGAATVGITINAPSTAPVNLKGLLIDGGGVGAAGIVFNSGKSLTVVNCVVRNVTTVGLQFLPTGSATLAVSNSYFTDNGGDAIFIQPNGSGITATAAIDRSGFYGDGGAGVDVDGQSSTGTLTVTVTDSDSSNNGDGFTLVSSAGQAVSKVFLTRVTATNNTVDGLFASGTNATMRIGQSTVTENATGYHIVSPGQIISYLDNYIDDNASDSGTLGSGSTH